MEAGSASTTADGAIADMLSMARACGKVNIVDPAGRANRNDHVIQEGPKSDENVFTQLDGSSRSGGAALGSGPSLPRGLNLSQTQCTQQQKDSQLYACLTTTAGGSSGPVLISCNSGACARRVSETLKGLGLPAKTAHANMTQVRCRMWGPSRL